MPLLCPSSRFLLPLSVLQRRPGNRDRIGPRDSPGPANFSTLHVHDSYRAISTHWNRVLQDPGRLTVSCIENLWKRCRLHSSSSPGDGDYTAAPDPCGWSFLPSFTTVQVLREPLSRQISHFFYFNAGHLRPEQLLDGREINRLLSEHDPGTAHSTRTNEFFPETRLQDTQMRLGHVNRLIRSGLFNRTVFLTLENFSEGIAALHLHCGWPLKDLAYGKIHCAECWDTKLAVKSPNAHLVSAAAKHKLSNATKAHIAEKLAPDAALYAAAQQSWETIRQRGGEQLAAAARELERRNAVVDDYCLQRVTTAEHVLSYPECLWLSLHPLEFISFAGRDGRLGGGNAFMPSKEHLGFPEGKIPARKIMTDYNAMYERLFPGGGGK